MDNSEDTTFQYQHTIQVLARGNISARDRTAAAVAVARGEGVTKEVLVEDWTALTDLTSIGTQRTDIEIFDKEAGEWATPPT